MRVQPRFTCCLIGQKSLLILCAEDLLTRGHEIRGIATENAEIRAWAAGRNIPVVSSSSEPLTRLLSENPCDYLFSIINYRVLPEQILCLPTKGAINFHDGPLPGYAGMYVTTWALLNGEREHGISWHWMKKEIDTGAVLKENRFPISADETAFSLNTKCYDAGFDAFRLLVNDLEQGTVSSRQQDENATGGYYGLRKRPDRMATLDWSRPAEELDALFRGLDFGRYENPIGRTKVRWGDQILTPGRLSVLDRTSTLPPGSLERLSDSNTVRVHTSTKVVELASLSTLDGELVEIARLAPLRHLESTAPAALDPVLERVCVHESFWAGRLAEREAVTLPYLPADIRRDQVPTRHRRRELDGRLLFATGQSTQFVSRAIAAISLYLGRLSGKEAFDVDYQGPSLAGLPPDSASYFATAVPLKTRLNWAGSFADHLQSTEEAITQLEKRGTYARDLVVRYPQITEEHRRKLREIPDVLFAVRPASLTEPAVFPQAQLAILISPSGSGIELVANADVFNEPDLDKIAAELAHVVAHVGANPQSALADVAVVSPCEQALLDRWNAETQIDFQPLSLPRAFAAQVERTPDATAIVFRGESISYRELNTRANQLANLLVARGVKRGDLVGVLMDRSLEMVVSLLATLKTGAAYVPMDPAYPPHRLAIMIEDAHPKIVLTQANWAAQIPAIKDQAVVFDRRMGLDELSTEFPNVAIEPNDVAYIIYTSGSTGRPKGVMVTHGNIHNFFLTIDRELAGDPPGTWLAATSISFDISIPELFWPLTRGARIVLRGSQKADQPAEHPQRAHRKVDFSLVFKNVEGRAGSEEGEPNGLLLQASRFAEKHGFGIRPETHALEAGKWGARNQPELSACITADSHPDTYRCAAEIGAHVMARLMGQPAETLTKNVALYRQIWKEEGHAGEGRVTVLVPTFVGPDDLFVKAAVREPMKALLKNDLSLVRDAAWEFPAFQRKAEEEHQTLDRFLETISDADLNELLEFAFERYYTAGGLFGTPARCLATVERLKEIGIDEIACLVDFGLTADEILQQLPELNELKAAANTETQDEDADDEDADDIATLIERQGVTHLLCTPPRAASLLWDPRTRRAMGNLKVMMVGGEALSEELARQLRSTVPGRVFNVYGPTETTVWSTMHELLESGGPVPIGRPIANTQLYVVDERQRALPVGVPGELLIGGDGVGRGYLKRPDLTQARFLQTDHGTVYRTGDLVRFRPDGVVEFLGRIDDQVKIRGHRIELGEIEAVLESDPSVRKAVVHPQDDAAGGKRLVAYLVPRSSNGLCVEALRKFASERLPEYMVPSLFEPVHELPLTPSGKVDRWALPKPNFGQRRDGAAQERTPPGTATERKLAELWQTLLDVADVDRADNFFELGGHSLLGMRAISKIQEIFGVRLPTKTFLVNSLAQVAAEIDRLAVVRQPIAEDAGRSRIGAALSKRLLRWFPERPSGEGNDERNNAAKNRV